MNDRLMLLFGAESQALTGVHYFLIFTQLSSDQYTLLSYSFFIIFA